MENNELQHHGIKGQKWGIRRTPAQLGHRTATKKIRTVSRFAEIKKKREAKAEEKKLKKELKKANDSVHKKPLNEMSDDDLMAAIRRSQLENQYRALNPDPVKESKGKRFVKSLGRDVIAPAAKNAGRQFLENALKKAGENLLKDTVDPDSLSALEEEWKKLDYKKKISDLKNPKNDEDEGARLKKEYQKLHYENEIAKEKATRDARNNSGKTYSDADSNSGDSGNDSSGKSDRKSSNTSDNTVYTGEVFGEGTSRKSSSEKTSKKSNTRSDTIYDAEWRDVSDISDSDTSSGRSYTNNLLISGSSSTALVPARIDAGQSYVYDLIERR